MNIQRDNVVEARRPDIMVVNKKKKKKRKNVKKKKKVDIAIPRDWWIHESEMEKVEKKKQKQTKKKKRLWREKLKECGVCNGMRNVEVVPFVVRAFGSVTKKFGLWIKLLQIQIWAFDF